MPDDHPGRLAPLASRQARIVVERIDHRLKHEQLLGEGFGDLIGRKAKRADLDVALVDVRAADVGAQRRDGAVSTSAPSELPVDRSVPTGH